MMGGVGATGGLPFPHSELLGAQGAPPTRLQHLNWVFFFFFFGLLGWHPWRVEVPRVGV